MAKKHKKPKIPPPTAVPSRTSTTATTTQAPVPAGEMKPEPLAPLSTSDSSNGAQDAFTQAYMRQIVAEFGDDIDAVRSSADFIANPKQALEVLIDGLRMGVERVPLELRSVETVQREERVEEDV